MAKKSAKLKEIQDMVSRYGELLEHITDTEALRSIRDTFETIEDQRYQPYVEYPLPDVVMICLIAVMSGANEWIDIGLFAVKKGEWLKTFLNLPNGIPSHDTIQRVISAINGDVLYSLSINFLMVRMNALSDLAWTLRQRREGGAPEETERERAIMPLDGKTSRGSKRNKTDRDAVAAVHTVSVYSTDNGFCLGEKVVEEKTNEITAVYDLLDVIDVQGAIVTWDALNTQKETVKKVVQGKGDYAGALKANHHTLHDGVKDYFDDPETMRELLRDDESKKKHTAQTIDKEQSGVSKREYYLSEDISWIAGRTEWAGLRGIGMVRWTQDLLTGEKTEYTRYFITSLTDIGQFARAVRTHWHIENKVHWHLDYTFKDDQNTTTEKHGAQNLQTLKRVSLAVLGLVRGFFGRSSLKSIRWGLSLDFEHDIEKIFRLLNVDAVRSLLLPAPP